MGNTQKSQLAFSGFSGHQHFLVRTQEEVTGFMPTPDDLDYPAKLQRLAAEPEPAAAAADGEQRPLLASNGSASAQDSMVCRQPLPMLIAPLSVDRVCPYSVRLSKVYM
jgi:hypothetical protein